MVRLFWACTVCNVVLIYWCSRLAPRDSSPTVASTCSDHTLTPDEVEKEDLCEEKEAYDKLVADGGCPSHPVSLGFDVLHSPGQYADILWFWHYISGQTAKFRNQLAMWQEFRDHQAKMRGFYVKRNRFHEYEQVVRKSQQNMQSDWDIGVRADLHEQNRLENWNEFRAYQLQYLKAYQRRIGPAELKLKAAEEALEAAEPRLTDAIVDRKVLLRRAREVVERKQKMRDAQSRFAQAQAALQKAKSTKVPSMIKVAEEDLHVMDQNLKDAAETDEFRRLREGYELSGLREGVRADQGRLETAKLDVERWEVFLQWIDSQYPTLASACGYLAKGASQHMTPSQQSFAATCNAGKRTSRPSSSHARRIQGRPVLSPTSSSKIMKASKGRSNPLHRARLPPCTKPQQLATSQSVINEFTVRRSQRLQDARITPAPGGTDVTASRAKKASTEPGKRSRRSKRISTCEQNKRARGLKSTSLRPIHSSRVSKTKRRVSGGAQSIKLHVHDTKVPTNSDRRRNKRGILAPSFAPSADQKPLQQPGSADIPLRRSTRIPRKPEWFRAG